MKKLIYISIAVLLLSGCSKKWCNNNYPCIDSTNYKEVTKFDTTYLQVPGDTTYIELPFDCPDQQIIYKEGKKETKIVVKDRKIYINQITKADSLAIVNWFKQTDEFKQYSKEVEISVKYIPKWIWLVVLGLLLIVVWQNRSKVISSVKWLSKLMLKI